MFKIKSAIKTVSNKGPGFCVFRAWYEFAKLSGILKRKFPAVKWSEINPDNLIKTDRPISLSNIADSCNKFFFDPNNLPSYNSEDNQKLLASAEKILNKEFQYFSNEFKSLGPDPDWFINPFTNAKGCGKRHWCDIKHFDPEVGDIKFIWEPSRFGWVYTLARAYAFTKSEKYAKNFWLLFGSWLNSNQPNIGHNYVCGQECAIRIMAMCFGLFVFAKSSYSTSEKIESILKAIYVHADRIEKNISYAISTKTNHSITEAAGIYTVGLLFPFFKKSENWKNKGKKILVKEGLRQIYDDGSYIQHSMNYHRLMLQAYIWVLRLADINNEQFPEVLTERVKKAVDFIYQLQDDDSGRVPNYGANDGALIIPLNNCDYLDYRPVIQSGYYLFNQTKLYESGPWDEDSTWLFSRESLKNKRAGVPKVNLKACEGGYYTIRNKDSWAMMRCHSFKDRPGHADMLHLDLWWKGVNILRDSGSYLYNCPEKWQKYFMGTSSHNTVVVDDKDQMVKGNLWNWFEWTKSKFLGLSEKDGVTKMSGAHYGYERLGNNIIHKRDVYAADNYWIIVDSISGQGKHKAELNWQLCDKDVSVNKNNCSIKFDDILVNIKVVADIPIELQYYFGNNEIPFGFESLYYGQKQGANSIKAVINKNLPIQFITIIGLGSNIDNFKYSKINKVLEWQKGSGSGIRNIKLDESLRR